MFGDGLGSPSNVGKHGNQGVGWWLEAPGLDGGGTVSREDLQLLLGIGPQAHAEPDEGTKIVAVEG